MGTSEKAWVVAVEMGYGHLRAARPLAPLAYQGKLTTADDYDGIPKKDRLIWEESTKFYHAVSRLKEKGVFGALIFKIFDYFQRVGGGKTEKSLPGTGPPPAEKPTFQMRQSYNLIKKGWGRDLIERLNKTPLPLLATFFTIGHMAEYWRYKGPVYVLVTDADVSRAWAPLNPETSRLIYLTPTAKAKDRLISYGVNPKNIFITGFPLPAGLLGPSLKTANDNLKRRLEILDARGRRRDRPPVVTFTIGGAGAQGKIGREIIEGLASLIKKDALTLYLIAGVHKKLALKFYGQAEKSGLGNFLNKRIFIIQNETKEEYFEAFNDTMMKTDILWTKPSELSFYAGLGLPIIMAPPLGAHEVKNKEWLEELGAGIPQQNPSEAGKWLPELIQSGQLAEAARAGFEKIEKRGVENIARIIFKKHQP